MNDIEVHSSTIPGLSGALRARLFTNWGTVLYVDAASGELRHGPLDSPANAIFVADPASSEEERRGWLMHDTGSALEPIVCLTEHSWSAAGSELDENAPAPTPFELIHLERGILGLRSGGRFLSALPDGRMALSTMHCSIWECFLASEDWCTPSRTAAAVQDLRRPGHNIEWRQIAAWIPEPMHRVQSRNTAATKVVIWGHTQWSHGRVYYDVCKALTERGYVVDLLDWTVGQGWKMPHLLSYYDSFLTALNGIGTLIDTYRVPADRIIGLSHHERDIRMLIDEKGVGVFDEIAGYGVVGYQLYDASAIFGVRRSPLVVQLGVNNAEFGAELPERLGTVGYASSYSHVTPEGVEMKRGDIAEAAAGDAGLDFKIAGFVGGPVSFHDMPEFYRTVDAVLVSSLTEGAQLPIREAAASGRLVISTPVGDFPLRAAQGMGIIAPIEAHKYKKFVAETLRFYKDNPEAFVDKCRQIKEGAARLDWEYTVDDWIELIETAKLDRLSTDEQLPKDKGQTALPQVIRFSADWGDQFSGPGEIRFYGEGKDRFGTQLERFIEQMAKALNRATELCRIMNDEGSDKGRGWHNYTLLYHHLLGEKRNQICNVFEVGLGTNFVDVPSNMGHFGVPGASLRGWRRYFPKAEIFGADVDRRILFSEPGISTFYVDQLQADVIQELWIKLQDTSFDIMIDDGLHVYEANSTFLQHSIHKLTDKGCYVIEDISNAPDNIGKFDLFFHDIGVHGFLFVSPNRTLSHDNCIAFIQRN